MRIRLSSAFVKKSLTSHSWVGLMVGALMYLVCLSGTLAVFYPELERWEQPDAPELAPAPASYDPAVVDEAYANALAAGLDVTHHMYVGLPNESMPRLTVSSEESGWIADRDGQLVEPLNHDWTHLLIDLHLYLHLPESFGMILVSALGAMLCALVVSGFLSHPRILKDAFALRLGRSRRLEQVDIHNRLSVWGAPFHLMIAITGAYFGLALPIAAVLAQTYYGGDTDALLADVFGGEPVLSQPERTPALSEALSMTREMAPSAVPQSITIENADEPEKQYVVVGAQHPNRLSYWEEYRFDGAGNFIDQAGFMNGAAGKQAIYSIYRLHFGHFGGFGVALAYGVFGLALTIVSVTGINIWLARRKTRDFLNNLWAGCVWGAPAALVATALAGVLLGAPSVLLFWVVLAGCMVAAQLIDDERRARLYLQAATAAALFSLVAGHALRFGSAAFDAAALGINAAALIAALVFALLSWRQWRGRVVSGAHIAGAPAADRG